MKLERRYFPADEIRVTGDGDEPRLTGYAAVFNAQSEDLGGFREIILPGAFADAVDADDVRALWNHDPNYVLGRTTSGTLTLAEDDHGLRIDNRPPDTQWARDLLVSIARGDVSQMSFGFSVVDDEWRKADGTDVRYLKKVRLFDISPVTFPAYPDTTVQARAIYDDAQKRNRIPTEPTPAEDDQTSAPTRLHTLKHSLEIMTLKRRMTHAS